MDALMVWLGLGGSELLVTAQRQEHVPLYIIIPAVILLWGIVIAICRHTKNTSCWLFGTHLYGERASANGYLTTKWIVFFMVPLFPIATYEVVTAGPSGEHSAGTSPETSQSVQPRLLRGFCWQQVLLTLLIGWGILAVVYYVLVEAASK